MLLLVFTWCFFRRSMKYFSRLGCSKHRLVSCIFLDDNSCFFSFLFFVCRCDLSQSAALSVPFAGIVFVVSLLRRS